MAAPSIKRFTSAAVGQAVTITGANLSGATRVAFDGATAAVVTDGPTSVVAVVPTDVTPGPISVQTPGGTATSAKSFSPVPTITSVSPPSGAVGSSVTLGGTGLAGVKKVTIHGKKAVVVADTPTAIVVTVPKKATSGPVTVVTTGGSVTSSTSFTVT